MGNHDGKVGPFFYLDETVVSDSLEQTLADSNGVFRDWGSHDRFWDTLVETRPEYQKDEYFVHPRGRVVYNTQTQVFCIYLNPLLNTPEIIEKVLLAFNLSGCRYTVDDTDIHYKFYTDEEFEQLMSENSFNQGTLTALQDAEEGKNLVGPFDNLADLTESLNAEDTVS